MNEILTPELDTDSSVKFFKDHYETFKPLKKAVVFFENENFVFTEYTPKNSGISAIFENWNGDQIQFSSLNVGYGGYGPGGTLSALLFLGFNDVDRYNREICYFPGITVTFDRDGNFLELEKSEDAFFESRFQDIKGNQLFLNSDYLFVNTLKKRIYFKNPQRNEFEKFLTLVKRSKPVSLEYWLGCESTLENWFRGRDYFDDGISIDPEENEVNLIIKGHQYSICCLIHLSELIDVINCIWLFLAGEKLFTKQVRYRKGAFYTSKWDIKIGKRKFLNIFSKIDESKINECVKIPRSARWMK